MAENDSITIQDEETLIKVEALAAINRVKAILSGLAAVALLRIHSAEKADFSPVALKKLYQDTPWVVHDGSCQEVLPQCLEEESNTMIFKQASLAWQELTNKAERVFGPEIYSLAASAPLPEEDV